MMRRSASFVLLLVLMAWPTVRLVAQSPNPANSYDGIDLLFIVDHSGSMGGTRYAASALYGEFGNDPNGWRFSLPQEALTFLDTFSAPAELESINVSVMAFGQNTEVLLDWITVGQGESGLPWEAVLDNALEALSALRFGFRNLGATHTRYAFQQARNVFDKAPSPSPGRRNYRAIVILTDGMPCEQFNPAFQVDNLLVCPNPVNNYRNLNASRAELQQLVAEMRRNHPETAVYVIGMDVQGDFWDRTQDLWQRVACETDPAACAEQASDPVRYQGVSTDRGAGLALNRALLDIFNRAAPLSVRAIPINPDGSFGLPPYLAFFRLSFYKDSPNVLGVRFTAPDGLSVGLDTRGADTVIQTHRIADPAPGTWRYQVDDPNRIISVIPSANAIAARVNAEVVFGRLQQGATAPLKLTITNESGAPLLVYPDYPLSVVAHIYDARDPSPERQRRLESLSLQADPSAIGIAQFIANWSPGTEIEGRIGVRVEVSYTSPGGGETVLIPEQPLAGHFEVIRTTVEWLGVTSEREDRPISLGGRLTSADGGDFGNLESLVVGARLRDIDGNQIIPDKPDGWQVLPPGLRGINEVVGQFIPQVAGNFQLEQAIGVVAPDGDFRPIFVQPVTNPLTVRPIRRLRLLMTRPQGGRQAAQKLSLVPPIFDFNVPIDVQVELRDQNDQPFSLAEVTGGQELVPQLTVNDTPLELREIGAGIYVAQDAPGTFALGERVYKARVTTGDEVLLGDAEWSSDAEREVSASVERTLSSGMYVLGGVLLLGLLAVVGTFAAYRQLVAMRKPYMTGSLWVSVTQAFETNDAQPYEIPLSQYQNSRARLSTADGLPPNLIARISNQRNEHQLYLLELRLGKQDLLGVPRKQLTENPSVFKDTEGNVYTLWYAPEGSYFTPETDNTIL